MIGFTSLLTTAVHRLCEKYHKLKVVIHYSGGFPGLIDGLFIGGYLSVAFLFSLKLENILKICRHSNIIIFTWLFITNTQ